MSLKDKIDKIMNAMNAVPNCPSCNGTGEHVRGWSERVFWKGALVLVCSQCKGTGKV